MPPAALDIGLPGFSTPFIGRQDEITGLTDLLHLDTCPLLTLIGPGGSGKTRLAVEVAVQMTDTFADGVYFVPLQPLRSADNIVTTIIDVLPLQLTGNGDPQQQLLNYLREKHLLLVLDNFEHLLDGVSLVMDILTATIQVKLLVTSRERLDLQAEQVWPVQGLAVPGNDSVEALDQHSAVQLFVERAHRVQPDFSLDAQRDAVIHICRLVDGLPLALELAASWVRVIPCDRIADDIQRNIDILTTTQRDLPQRHQSMRAVFDHSWSLLAEEERAVFAKLAVFRGGFTLEAAQQVAGASLQLLAALIDKSLVQADGSERYDLHELAHQYARIHLQSDTTTYERACQNHARYYIEYLQARSDIVEGGPQGTATIALNIEIENLRSAWQWVTDHDPALPGPAAPFTMGKFLQHRNRYIEGRTLFESLVPAFNQPGAAPRQRVTLFETLGQLGWSYIRTGHFDQAYESLEQQDAIMKSLDSSLMLNLTPEPQVGLCLIASLRGDYDKAITLGEQARQRSIQQGNRRNLMMASYVLVSPLRAQGRYEEARHYAEQNYALAREENNYWFMALALNDLGSVAQFQGDFQAAKKYHQESYDINQNQFHDREGVARSLNYLAYIAAMDKNEAEAWSLHQKSVDIYREIGDRAGLAETLTGLGKVAGMQQKYPLARQYLRESLQHARSMGLVPIILTIFIVSSELLLRQRRYLEGIRLLSFVQQHPAAEFTARSQAENLRKTYQTRINTKAFASGWAEGQAADIETLIDQLEAEFSPEDERTPQERANEALPHPLTTRELEVLNLLADGLRDREIAAKLHVSQGTIRNPHMMNIRQKLEARNRTEAILKARKFGLIL